jgi:hypothetical protein
LHREEERQRTLRPWDFDFYPVSLQEDWNRRENKRRVSILADVLKERATHPGVAFADLVQAELILYLRAAVEEGMWWPHLLIFREDHGVMEVFARARSKTYARELLRVLGASSKEEFIAKVNASLQRRPIRSEGFWDFSEQLNEHLDLKHFETLP